MLKDFEKIKFAEPMSAHTTFRTGGDADFYAEPESEEELLSLLAAAKEEKVDVLVVGNGSNLLVRDKGIRGLVVHLGKNMSKIEVEGNRITAQGGALMSAVAKAALDNSLGGFEFASGIPGSMGGGLYMNAGAYGGAISDVVLSARYIKDGRIFEIEKEDMKLSYRHSVFCENDAVITSVTLALNKSDKAEITEKMNDYKMRRKEKQPLEFASAGSTFKRPEGHFAGALIEQAGLKGVSIGAAQVSQKHAGFIINRGGATSDEILQLMEYVTKKVYENSGVWLTPEVKTVGEE